MLTTINDMISISKIEKRKMRVSNSETNLNEVIEYIYSLSKQEVEEKGIKLLHEQGLPLNKAIVHTDQNKIIAILINLLKTVIKFTETGSIKFGYVKGGSSLIFFIKNTDIGINNEQKDIVNKKSRRVSAKLILNYSGYGLGLSFTKAYVELLGGKIWVESDLSMGLSAYFTIPYEPIKKEQIHNNKHKDFLLKPVTSTKDLKILIAEDNKVSEILIRELLNNFAREMITVKSGIEAVNTCRSNPGIDLILMNIQMPKMDGYEATKQIRLFNEKVVIVAQTAITQNREQEKAIDAGCDDFISKPFTRNVIEKLLEKHFGQN